MLMINELVKLKKKKAGGDKYRYTALIDTKYSMNNVDVGLHSNDKSAIKTLNGILKRKFPKEKRLKENKVCLDEKCWKGYEKKGMKKMFGKMYPNCVKKEHLKITTEQARRILDNLCIYCSRPTNENLRKWFKDRWVNIGKKKKGGGHPPCGTSGKKRGYAKCVPASKARGMSKKQKASATRRKRAAQNKAGRGGTSSLRGGGKKPIRVNTKQKK